MIQSWSLQDEEGKTKLCLMARYESSFSHTSSISLKEKNNYTQLLYAFEELYD